MSVAGPITRSQTNKTKLIGILDSILSEFRPPPPPVVPESAEDAGDVATPTNIIEASVADADQVIRPFVDLATPTNIIEASVADADQVIQSFVDLATPTNIIEASVADADQVIQSFVGVVKSDAAGLTDSGDDELSSTGEIKPRSVTSTTRKDYGFSPIQSWDFEVIHEDVEDVLSSGVDRPRYVEVSFPKNGDTTSTMCGGSGNQVVSKHVSNKSKVTGGENVVPGTVAAPKSDNSRRPPIVTRFTAILTKAMNALRRITNISRQGDAPIQPGGEDLSSVSRNSSTGPLTEEMASDKSSEIEPDVAGIVDDVGDAVVPRDAAVPRDAVDDVSDTADDDDNKSVASTRNVNLTIEEKSEMEKLSDLIKQLKDAAPQLKSAIESGQISSDELQELLNQFTDILKPPVVTTTPSTEAIPGSAATGTVGPAVTGSPDVPPSGTVASAALESPRSVSDPPRPSSPTAQIPPVTRGPTMLDRIRQAIGKYTSRLNLVTLSRSARETVPLLGVAPSGSSTTPTELSQIKSEKSAVFRKGIVDLISSIPKILDSARAELKTTLEGESTTNISELVRDADRVVSRFIPMTTTDKVDITELVRDADRVVSRFIPIVPPAKPINIAELVRDADRVVSRFIPIVPPAKPVNIAELVRDADRVVSRFIPIVPPAKPVNIAELVRDADRVVSRFIPIVPPAKPVNIADLVRDADRVVSLFIPIRTLIKPAKPVNIAELVRDADRVVSRFIPIVSPAKPVNIAELVRDADRVVSRFIPIRTLIKPAKPVNIAELVRDADRVVSRFIPIVPTAKTVNIAELVRDADRVVSRFIPIVPTAKTVNIAELVRDADRVIKHFTKPLRPTSPTSITELFNTAKNTLQQFIPTNSDTGKRKLSNQSTEYTSAEDAENNEMLSKLKENNLLVSTHTDYISYTGDTPDDTAPAVYKYAIVDVQPEPTTPDTIAKDTSASIEKSVVYVPTIEEIPPSSKAAEKSG